MNEMSLDDIRGLVTIQSSEDLNETARDQQSRKQIFRIFIQYPLKISSSSSSPSPSAIKHFHVICDGISSSSSLR